MVLSKTASETTDVSIYSTFASRYVRNSLPRFEMPENSIPKEAAYQIINDELMLDGNPRLNLASFVTTWMEPECDKLMMESINKNYVDMDEYPVTTELQNRCVNMIARLFNAPLDDGEAAVGVGTVGSSEAIMLAGLAFKRQWQNKRKAQGLPYDKPNIVTGANVQGYRNVMDNCRENMMVLREGLEKTGRFNIVSKENGVPLVAFSLKDSSRHDEFEVAETLRRFGWIVPAYTMPADAEHVTVLRVVIREDFSRTLAERLVADFEKVLRELDTLPAKVHAKMANG
ncbi:hypothetical protein F2Q68_00020363 [Brassica cretica]|uniref:glutamate decarboxylase n=1 Tax=Brassica cretica TaxID=69181 RepID=A0A8S9FSD3_BRACR|nr:hypothetical protein F2Q68_00020363 [Brassica cretica]